VNDPLRMHLVVRRGAIDSISRGGELAGAAAVACVARFEHDPEYAGVFAAWRPRPGKVVLRARGGQWDELLRTEALALAGDPGGEAVAALPPRPQSARSELLRKMQAMSSELEPPPHVGDPAPAGDGTTITYILNPRARMSSGKTLAQVAHAAVIAADSPRMHDWIAAGCPGRVLATSEQAFDALAGTPGCVAEVVDGGLTEVPPGTVTVRALAPVGSGS
jgi:peptidyl-tRNA hydrolase